MMACEAKTANASLLCPPFSRSHARAPTDRHARQRRAHTAFVYWEKRELRPTNGNDSTIPPDER